MCAFTSRLFFGYPNVNLLKMLLEFHILPTFLSFLFSGIMCCLLSWEKVSKVATVRFFAPFPLSIPPSFCLIITHLLFNQIAFCTK